MIHWASDDSTNSSDTPTGRELSRSMNVIQENACGENMGLCFYANRIIQPRSKKSKRIHDTYGHRLLFYEEQFATVNR